MSNRVLYFTRYSMGLRLGEDIHLQVRDLDAAHHRVHIRDTNRKGGLKGSHSATSPLDRDPV